MCIFAPFPVHIACGGGWTIGVTFATTLLRLFGFLGLSSLTLTLTSLATLATLAAAIFSRKFGDSGDLVLAGGGGSDGSDTWRG